MKISVKFAFPKESSRLRHFPTIICGMRYFYALFVAIIRWILFEVAIRHLYNHYRSYA